MATPSTYRDRYYQTILSFIGNHPGGSSHIAGANFWAFGGASRPIKGQTYWKQGDPYMGDPPMEEQGLNSVFDSDHSTWKMFRNAAMHH